MSPRRHVTFAVAVILVFLIFSYFLTAGHDEGSFHVELPIDSVLKGTATAPKLENATLKAELGNAAWKLLHTTMAKFPDHPTAEDSSSLKSYIYLFARLYPCGDCARHFQGILKNYPPQVGSRSSAATWACHVHNEVNKRLEKEIFDCNKIGDFYDCGCGGGGEGVEGKRDVKGKTELQAGGDIEEANVEREEKFTPLHLDKDDGLIRGG